MGFNSRYLVLEFIAEYRNLGIEQMTFVLFGKQSDQFLTKTLDATIDKVYAYHNKGSRLFWKDYEFNKLSGTIIELIIDSQSSINLAKKDLTFTVKDPYYFLDLRKFSFDYLSMIPLKDEEDLLGYVLLYGNKVIEESDYPIIRLKKLLRDIIKSENKAKYEELDELLASYEKLAYLEFDGGSRYLSKRLASLLEIPLKYDGDQNTFKQLLDAHDLCEGDWKKENSYVIHWLESTNKIILAKDDLDFHHYGNEFTLLYLKKFDDTEILTTSIKSIEKSIATIDKIFEHELYKISDNSLVILFSKKLMKKDINNMMSVLVEYHPIMIRSDFDLPAKASLMKVIDYLEKSHSQKFVMKEYQFYRLNQTVNLKEDDVIPYLITKNIYKGIEEVEVGVFYDMPQIAYDDLVKDIICQTAMISQLTRDTKKFYMIRMTLDTLLDNDYYNEFKDAIGSLSGKLIVIGHVLTDNAFKYTSLLDELQKLGVMVVVDQSFIEKIKLWGLFSKVDGIFGDKDPTSKLVVDDPELIREIIDYFINHNKMVILELEEELLELFKNPDVYLVKSNMEEI